ncbi:MAG: bifunctional DNA-formamidopyrimidine glycosylase/DNA-(apurinic or apyrimidinic site) lyase [Planctomycetaceae bacterium]|nr:bifunctional DNA-formamidopyrimidine glycosylase/DNA-(apurinic or apyrimidinic site) lyase [Planctomycetaceae bacterium]
MPELPEVETMVRGIRPRLIGATLTDFAECPCACRPLLVVPSIAEMRKRTIGQPIADVRRRGKRAIIELENREAFIIEPRMTGLLLLGDPPSVEHLRLYWSVESAGVASKCWFWDRRGLGTVRLMSESEREANLESGQLGPEVLSMSLEEWWKALSRTSRPIKVALLDQKLFAGIGNLYASEILHLAKVSPMAASNRISRGRVERIRHAAVHVLETAILYEGSTLADGTYRNALNQNGSYQNQHRVYARQGETCRTCGLGIIRRIVQAQRATFYCPRCQRR